MSRAHPCPAPPTYPSLPSPSPQLRTWQPCDPRHAPGATSPLRQAVTEQRRFDRPHAAEHMPRAVAPRAQTRQGAPALIRYMQNHENDKMRARAEKRPADGDYGAATARRDCSGARGGIPMGSTAPMSLAVRAQLPGAAWGWLWRPVSLLTIPLDDFAPLGGLGRPCARSG